MLLSRHYLNHRAEVVDICACTSLYIVVLLYICCTDILVLLQLCQTTIQSVFTPQYCMSSYNTPQHTYTCSYTSVTLIVTITKLCPSSTIYLGFQYCVPSLLLKQFFFDSHFINATSSQTIRS